MNSVVSFPLFELLFFAMFGLVFCIILISLFRGLSQWNKNNHAPRLTVPVTVAGRRTEISRRHRSDTHMSHTSTTYYVTFQVESGDRMELQLSGQEYGLIIDGDRGLLTFQGTRFLSFERNI